MLRALNPAGEICQLLLCFQVSKNGLTNSVFTLYELVSGDDTADEGNAASCSSFSGHASFENTNR